MRMRVLGPLALLALLHAGCVHVFVMQAHDLAFKATLVSGDTGAAAAGAHVVVRAGDELIFEGPLDENGTLAFTHTYTCCHKKRPLAGEKSPHEDFTITFVVDAGQHGVLEIPVKIGHGRDAVALGELRLVPMEGS